MDDAAKPLTVDVDLPERLGYRLKRRLLGPPLTSDQLDEQRLANPVAFGVLSPDCISSSAYGSEEILIELLPYAGMAAFALVLPITGVILGILLLLLFSYRQVVSVYTKAGGSYVVARENFGPRVAQIAAVALLIDYVVTVAVQTAAGTVAVVSAIPALGPYSLALTLGVVALLSYGNLRGIREAGRAFAFPLYFFVAMAGLVIVVGVIREIAGHLPVVDPHHLHGVYSIHRGGGFVAGATLLVLLRSFANGGSSLTGFEAISNGVSAFRAPEGRNARRVLVIMAGTLAFLVGGVSWLAHATHATPYLSGYPSVISQEARLSFGHGVLGSSLFYLMQAASALILYTGANTSFNGFPFLANFVASDRFLPRQLTRRGHRLVFSNAIILLTLVSAGLLVVTRAKVNALVPFYAIGVFTGFAMAGYGMARHFARERGRSWRRSVAVNLAAGVTSTIVVGVFAIAKFTEGAWVVVVVFPVLVVLLIRLNREYREEAESLCSIRPEALSVSPNFSRHVVLLFVNDLDLAVVGAVRYGQTMKSTELRAVHFALDSEVAARLATMWGRTVSTVGLEIVDVPDRRLGRASLELVARETATSGTHVTVLLPRRGFSGGFGRVLHDRTADKIARIISKVPNATATIVPLETGRHDRPAWLRPTIVTRHRDLPFAEFPAGVDAIGQVAAREKVTVRGRIRSVRLQPLADSPMLVCEVVDATGGLEILFYGRRSIQGIVTGATIIAEGRTTSHHGKLAIANPRYELIASDLPSPRRQHAS